MFQSGMFIRDVCQEPDILKERKYHQSYTYLLEARKDHQNYTYLLESWTANFILKSYSLNFVQSLKPWKLKQNFSSIKFTSTVRILFSCSIIHLWFTKKKKKMCMYLSHLNTKIWKRAFKEQKKKRQTKPQRGVLPLKTLCWLASFLLLRFEQTFPN